MPRLDEQDLKRIWDFVKVSEAYRQEKFETARNPKRMRRWFAGDHFGAGMPLSWVSKRDRVIVNLSQANVVSKISKLAFSYPAIEVTGLDNQPQQVIESEKQHLETAWRQINALKACRRALFDCKIVGTGALATGWHRTGMDSAEDAAAAQEATAPDPMNPEKRQPNLGEDRPVVRRVKPGGLILDPDSPEDIQKGWWCGETITIPLWRARKMARYKHVADRLKGDSDRPGAYLRASASNLNEDALRVVTVNIVYFRDSLMRVELSPEIEDEPLYVGDEPMVDYPLDGEDRPYFPYVLLANIPDYNGPDGDPTHFGIGDVEITETQQIEEDVARSLLAQHRRMSSPQYLLRKGLLTPEVKRAVAEGKYNAMHEVEVAINESLSNVIFPVVTKSVDQTNYTTNDLARRDMSELTRTSSYDRATETPNVKTATEASMLQSGSDAGKGLERQEYEMGVCDAMEQVAWLLHRWGDTPQMVTVGEGQQQEVTGVGLAGRYRYIIEPESMEPPNTMVDEQKWFARLQGLLPYIPMGVDPKPLLQQWLSSFDSADAQAIVAGIDQAREAAAQGPRPEPPKISLAVSFADLPTTAKAQVLGMIGIQVSPEEIVAEDEAKAQQAQDQQAQAFEQKQMAGAGANQT